MSRPAPSIILGLGEETLQEHFTRRSMEWIGFQQKQELLASAELTRARAVVLDRRYLPSTETHNTFQSIHQRWPLIDVVLWAPNLPASEVREALRLGYRDVVLEPSRETLVETVERVVKQQQLLPHLVNQNQEAEPPIHLEGLYSRSPKMWEIFETCKRIANTDATVLIQGETGTGKELLARAIHRLSGRSGNFVVLNSGAVSENLVDSELFGHIKGSFTGATHNKMGLFRHADRGTILLDEIGNIPLEVQYRLLRVLQENAVRPVGGHEEIPIDVRVIAATNSPLEEFITKGRFREDLYYRLHVLNLIIPPLRERPEDIIFLFGHFARQYAQQYDLKRPPVSYGFLRALQNYDWPGNVRQLENFTERLLLTHRGGELQAEDFFRHTQSFQGKDEFGQVRPRLDSGTMPQPVPVPLTDTHTPSGQMDAPPSSPALHSPIEFPSYLESEFESVEDLDLEQPLLPEEAQPQMLDWREQIPIDLSRTLEENIAPLVSYLEKSYLTSCLVEHQGRVEQTAHHAGINRRTLLRKMKKYGIDKNEFRHQ